MSDLDVREDRLAELLGAEGPALPAPDLAARIMAALPDSPESAFDRWNRVALPVALAAALAASLLVALTSRPRPPVDPIDAITSETQARLDGLIAVEDR